MSNLKKIIAWISAFAIIISVLCFPSFASSGSQYEQATVPFWDWFVRLGGNYNLIGTFLGYTSGTVCSKSDDGYHHANISQTEYGNGYYNCICSYCGQHFKAYESDLKQSYDKQVSDLPASIYSSTGGLCWKIVPYVGYIMNSGSVQAAERLSDYVRVVIQGRSGSNGMVWLILNEDFKAPIDGTYSLSAVTLDSSYMNANIQTYGHNFDKLVLAGGVVAYRGNYSMSDNILLSVTPADSTHQGYWYGYLLISCVPHIPPSGGTYTTNTRPTGITGGNYGIVGDNGQITTVVDNSTIVNETNNTYYNPATGQKETITNWTYDYSSRSYDITLKTGDKVTVTYGDQNITIIQGGDTYNIYYIIDGGCVDPDPDPEPTETPGPSDPDPTDPPHFEHSWKQTGRTEPTCTAPGQIQYICERCGQTQVELIPPNGHTWQQKQFVPTTYDDEGNLIEQGYTIYECSVCGEQYRDDKGTGPPSNIGSGSDIDDGGLLGFLNSLTKYLSDNLSGVVELIVSFFRTIPELFSGFTAFLTAMFPFLPDEVMMLLTFGIAALVIIGVIKAIRR